MVSGSYDYPDVSLEFTVDLEVTEVSCAISGTTSQSGKSIASTLTCNGETGAWNFSRSSG